MPAIRVPDISKTTTPDSILPDGSTGLDFQEIEVTDRQAASWNSLIEKQQLTLVLRADRERKNLRDYL